MRGTAGERSGFTRLAWIRTNWGGFHAPNPSSAADAGSLELLV